jgi:hypothetical protein
LEPHHARKQPELNQWQEAHLVALLHGGECVTAELAGFFGVARSAVYRAVEREQARNVMGVGNRVG